MSVKVFYRYGKPRYYIVPENILFIDFVTDLYVEGDDVTEIRFI